MPRSSHDGVRLEVTFCPFCNIFPRCCRQTKDLKPPEIGVAFWFCNISACGHHLCGSAFAHRPTSEVEAVARMAVVAHWNRLGASYSAGRGSPALQFCRASVRGELRKQAHYATRRSNSLGIVPTENVSKGNRRGTAWSASCRVRSVEIYWRMAETARSRLIGSIRPARPAPRFARDVPRFCSGVYSARLRRAITCA